MADKKEPSKFKTGCGCGCLTVIVLTILVLVLAYGCSGGTEDPNSQAEDELALLDNHYNEIKTDIGNLNVTGHGDFVNMMDDQISFAQASIQELDENYGDESEVINLCKQAWTDLSGMARCAKDGITNNDSGYVTMLEQLKSEYETTIQQIQSMIQQ